ncbi:unnamed protein product [Musa textilis]
MEIFCRRRGNPLPGRPIHRYLIYPITLSPSCWLSGPATLLGWCRSRSRSGTRRQTSSQLSLLDSRCFVSSLGYLASLNLPKNSFAKCNLEQVLQYAKREGRSVSKASSGQVMMSCSKAQCSSNLTSTRKTSRTKRAL